MFHLLATEDFSVQRNIAILICVAGLANGLLLGVVNAAAGMAASGEFQVQMFFLFAEVLAVFFIAKRIGLGRATTKAEQAVCDIRMQLSDKIRKTELLFLEQTGHADIYARLTQDTAIISQSIPVILNGIQSAVVIFAGLLYMLWLSWDAFLFTSIILLAGGITYVIQSRKSIAEMTMATRKETEFFDSLEHLVHGFKELKINQRKNDAVYDQIKQVSQQTTDLMAKGSLRYVDYAVFSQFLVYIVIGTLVFVLPNMEISGPEKILKLSAAILFIIGPLDIAFHAYRVYSKTRVSVRNINTLDARLDRILGNPELIIQSDPDQWKNFHRIEFRNVVFRYPGEKQDFQIGPLSMEFRRGEITFLIGGNGCGKSTLLKVLSGLYRPTSGDIYIDGKQLSSKYYAPYRELFACIFTDFHLFDRLYDPDEIDPQKVRDLLVAMELDTKTDYADHRFTNLDLSTGQRKRLALIAALLENKSIYIFDEWAVDQDTHFRQKFYEKILPDLKQQGKTIIAVSHDDRYFAKCDHLYKLEYGELVNYNHD